MRLSEWRKSRGLRQEPVAVSVGVTTSQFSKIERGETWTSGEVAARIREVTEGAVTPDDLHEQWREYQAERAA